MKNVNLLVMFSVLAAGSLLTTSTAQADMKQIKVYKEAYPDAKLTCINCHDLQLPKKAEGEHENNDYGKAVLAEAVKDTPAVAAGEEVVPTVDTYKKVGPIENFKK